jgi:hypothetical protein
VRFELAVPLQVVHMGTCRKGNLPEFLATPIETQAEYPLLAADSASASNLSITSDRILSHHRQASTEYTFTVCTSDRLHLSMLTMSTMSISYRLIPRTSITQMGSSGTLTGLGRCYCKTLNAVLMEKVLEEPHSTVDIPVI